MNDNQSMSFVDLEEMNDVRNRIKLCYAFAASKHFYHQEISIINPNPTQIDPQFVMPRDLFLFSHHVDHNEKLPPLETVTTMAVKCNSPIICIGSHAKQVDRSIQLICLPEQNTGTCTSNGKQMMLQYLCPLSDHERAHIVETLIAEYKKII